jgi:hypothetical protein
MTVTALTMEGSDGLFTSSGTGNGETRQKRKMHINEWADLKHKDFRVCKYSYLKERVQILLQHK